MGGIEERPGAPPWGGYCPGGENERHASEVSEPNRCVCPRADGLRALTLPVLPVEQRLSALAACHTSPGDPWKPPVPRLYSRPSQSNSLEVGLRDQCFFRASRELKYSARIKNQCFKERSQVSQAHETK